MTMPDAATRTLLEEFMAEIQECRARIERIEKRIDEMLRRNTPEQHFMP